MSLWKEQVNEIIESASPDRKSVFIGMGHPLRTDDNCGSYIIQKIIGRSRRETSDSVVFLDGEDNVENLITKVADLKPRHVVFVDACEMKESPGTTRLIPVSRTTFPFFTTHGVPLKLLAQQVLPESEVSILAIQPKNTDFGEKLSTEIRGVADLISDFVSELLRGREWQIGS